MNFKFYLLLIIILLSCTKNGESTIKDEISMLRELLIGEWHWYKSYYPWTQIESTPETTGISKTLIFTVDDRVRTLINGQLESEKLYELIYVNPNPFNPNQDSLLMLKIEGSSSNLFTVSESELIIDGTPYDGTRDYYKR